MPGEGAKQIRHRVSAVIVKDGKVLLFERFKHGRHYFIFPGGGVERGETIEDALKREVKEELSLEIVKHRFLFTMEHVRMPSFATDHVEEQHEYYFIVEQYKGVPELGGEEKERANEENQYHIVWLFLGELRSRDDILPEGNGKKVADFLSMQP